MSNCGFRECMARFLFILASMLVAMVVYYGVESILMDRPVVVPIDPPFKVENKVVHPGDVVTYHIHYYKRLDIPGELTKQLVVTDKQTGEKSYIPLDMVAGHLPVGDVQATAFAKIPEWAPAGKARIKISSSHFTGKIRQFATVYTEYFEVKK
jgi:hypothetical protein